MIDGTEKPKHDTRIWLQVGIFWVDILNSASRILQCWSNYVKINSASISTRHRKNSKQSGIVAIDSCFALFGARQYGVTTRESFLGYLKLMLLFFVLYHFMLPGNFYYGSEIRHGIFWGINVGPAIVWGFVWSPRDFGGFWFFPHSIIPVTWNLEYPLWAWVTEKDAEFVTLFIPS